MQLQVQPLHATKLYCRQRSDYFRSEEGMLCPTIWGGPVGKGNPSRGRSEESEVAYLCLVKLGTVSFAQT